MFSSTFTRPSAAILLELLLLLHVLHVSRAALLPTVPARIVATGDTHNREYMPGELPQGDVFIHVGDFILQQQPPDPTPKQVAAEVQQHLLAVANLLELPHRLKIVTLGNHDRLLQEAFEDEWGPSKPKLAGQRQRKLLTPDQKELLRGAYGTNIHTGEDGDTTGWLLLLHDSRKVTVHGAELTVFGSPLSYWRRKDAFTHRPGDDGRETWRDITRGTDIVITHGPPFDDMELLQPGQTALDRDANDWKQPGSEPLRRAFERARVPLVLFGHIHNSYPDRFHEYRFDGGAAGSGSGSGSGLLSSGKGLMANVAAVFGFFWLGVLDEECEYWTPKPPMVFDYDLVKRQAKVVDDAGRVARSGFPEYPPWAGPVVKPQGTKSWRDPDIAARAMKIKHEELRQLVPKLSDEQLQTYKWATNEVVQSYREAVVNNKIYRATFLGSVYGREYAVTYPQ